MSDLTWVSLLTAHRMKNNFFKIQPSHLRAEVGKVFRLRFGTS